MSWGREAYAAAYLSFLFEPGNQLLLAMIQEIGLVESAERIYKRSVPGKYNKLLVLSADNFDNDQWSLIVEQFKNLGGGLITLESASWPAWQLNCLTNNFIDTNYPQFTPFLLWYKGDIELITKLQYSVSIVGTRSATKYGQQVVEDCCELISQENMLTISGGAKGIDSLVHKSSLLYGGKTISILANGLLDPYPRTNHVLFQTLIKENNLLLSEYFPNTPVSKHRFLVRNRLVAALGDSILIVEAGQRSGTANTAAWANRLGKLVLAIPGPIYAKESIGCNNLIAKDRAYLVANPIDIVRYVKYI